MKRNLLFYFFIFGLVCLMANESIKVTKKGTYDLGAGSKITKQYKILNGNFFKFNSKTKNGFKFTKKGNSLEVTFDSNLLEEPEIGQQYSTKYFFNKANIGVNYPVTFKATYINEIYFKSNKEKLLSINLQPESRGCDIDIECQTDNFKEPFTIDYDSTLFKVNSASNFLFKKGINTITVDLLQEVDTLSQITLLNENNGGNSLTLDLKTRGFAELIKKRELAKKQAEIKKQQAEKSKQETIEKKAPVEAVSSASSGYGFFNLLIMVIAILEAIVIIFLLLKGKKKGKHYYDRFVRFFYDVAAIVDSDILNKNLSGNNTTDGSLESSMEEIIFKLMNYKKENKNNSEEKIIAKKEKKQQARTTEIEKKPAKQEGKAAQKEAKEVDEAEKKKEDTQAPEKNSSKESGSESKKSQLELETKADFFHAEKDNSSKENQGKTIIDPELDFEARRRKMEEMLKDNE